MDKLKLMFERQAKFQENFFSVEKLTVAEKESLTKEFVLLLVDEVVELLKEINYKHHVSTNHEVNYASMSIELVDVLKYWMNICIVWGIDYEDVYESFLEKSKIVEDRYEADKNVKSE